MRTARRLALSAAVLGGSLLIAAPATALEVDCDEYDTLAECPIDGGEEEPATGGEEEPAIGGGSEEPASGGGAPGTTATGGSSGGAASLPFTGGEVTLIALAGTAALGGGIALTAAGRKRTTG